MGVDENKRLIESFFEAGNRGDLETGLGLLDEHVRWTNIGSMRFSGRFVGKQTFIDELLGPLFSKLKSGIRSTIENIVAENDFVVVQSRGHAETVDGKEYNNTYCHVFKVANGRITEVTEYMDTELASSILGR